MNPNPILLVPDQESKLALEDAAPGLFDIRVVRKLHDMLQEPEPLPLETESKTRHRGKGKRKKDWERR